MLYFYVNLMDRRLILSIAISQLVIPSRLALKINPQREEMGGNDGHGATAEIKRERITVVQLITSFWTIWNLPKLTDSTGVPRTKAGKKYIIFLSFVEGL